MTFGQLAPLPATRTTAVTKSTSGRDVRVANPLEELMTRLQTTEARPVALPVLHVLRL